MSVALPSSLAPLTGDLIIDAVTHGYSWRLDQDRVLDISLSNGLGGEYWGEGATGALGLLGSALEAYAQFADISFNYLGYFFNPMAAAVAGSEINFTLTADPSVGSTWAFARFPDVSDTFYFGAPGDVFFNINSPALSLPSYEPGSQGFFLMLHELGHALGLKHPHDDGGTGRPIWSETDLLGDLDTDWFSIMSYNDDFDFDEIAYDPATPMLIDVLAIQYLYGKNMSANAGDDVHQLARSELYYTVWDAAGADWVSAAGQADGWMIVLPDAQISDLVDTLAGFAAPVAELDWDAPGTLVWLAGDLENAQGGDGGDILVGTAGANRLLGGAGDDEIEGLGGADVLHGNVGDDWLWGDGGRDIIRGGRGADNLDGGAGDDWLSGDRGDDTLAGGAGADTFHVFAESGLDIVTDFNAAEGDRVLVGDGAAWSATLTADGLMVSVGGSAMVLMGVTALPAEGWILG